MQTAALVSAVSPPAVMYIPIRAAGLSKEHIESDHLAATDLHRVLHLDLSL